MKQTVSLSICLLLFFWSISDSFPLHACVHVSTPETGAFPYKVKWCIGKQVYSLQAKHALAIYFLFGKKGWSDTETKASEVQAVFRLRITMSSNGHSYLGL